MTPQPHIAELLLEYCIAQKVTPAQLKKLSGTWDNKINDQWEIKLNPHNKDVGNVPAYSWYVTYNGWPAGVIGLLGDGVLCAGTEGNEENLRSAIMSKMKS